MILARLLILPSQPFMRLAIKVWPSRSILEVRINLHVAIYLHHYFEEQKHLAYGLACSLTCGNAIVNAIRTPRLIANGTTDP